MACENCKKGFAWDGATTGSETTLAGAKAYVTGNNKDAAVLIITDIFGWTLPNIRILADHYAKEADVTVYIPDVFDGEVIDPDTMSNPEKAKNFDLMGFLARHSKDVRWPQIKSSAQELKSQFPKVGAIGFCYGGWAAFKLGADPSLIDAIATAHPSLLDKAEIDAVKVPVQIIAPENDFTFTDELKAYALAALPKTGVKWEYVYFPGLTHGFAARGDQNNKEQREGLERAKRCVVRFFAEFLH